MKLAKWIFLIAGIFGLLSTIPLAFAEKRMGDPLRLPLTGVGIFLTKMQKRMSPLRKMDVPFCSFYCLRRACSSMDITVSGAVLPKRWT